MKRMRTTIFFLLLGLSAAAQTKERAPFTGKGLLRAMATISPGMMTAQSANNLYLHGNIEYYLDRKISLRGDGYYFLGTAAEDKPFAKNHSLFAGASLHRPTGSHFDPYIGLKTGLSITQNGGPHILIVGAEPETKFNPLLSPHLGINFYGEKVFHIFGEVNYVIGKHFPDHEAATSLGEVRVSFGLGFNLWARKKAPLPGGPH